MIDSGVLKPGDKIPTENVFAKEIGVSRGILREALNILQTKGYISRKPGNGTYVREIPEKGAENYVEEIKKATYSELIEARDFLEQKIVELVIERATDEEILELEDYLDDTKQNSQKKNFHIKLSEMCKNMIFNNFMMMYYELMREMKKESIKNSERINVIVEEHREIYIHIKNRDKEKAKEAISKHFKLFKNSIETIIN